MLLNVLGFPRPVTSTGDRELAMAAVGCAGRLSNSAAMLLAAELTPETFKIYLQCGHACFRRLRGRLRCRVHAWQGAARSLERTLGIAKLRKLLLHGCGHLDLGRRHTSNGACRKMNT